MKKIMLLCLAILSLLHSKEDFYSEEVLSLSLDKGTKAVGRLLPTNPFQILKQEGDWVKILISGYSNPQAPFAIYLQSILMILKGLWLRLFLRILLCISHKGSQAREENGIW